MIDLPTDLKPLVVQGNALDLLAQLPPKSVHVAVFSPAFWGLRRYDVCGCAQDYTRGDSQSPYPQFFDGPIHSKDPDPKCPWCHGTGKIPGMETTWGGDPGCDHEWMATPPRRPRRVADTGNLQSHGNYEAGGGRLCPKCGCWFGCLGLEPTVGLYVEHMVEFFRALRPAMRDDSVIWCEIGDTFLTHPSGVTGAKRWKESTLKNRDHTAAEQAGLMDKRQPGLKEGNIALVPHRVAIALQDDGWVVRQDNVWNRPNPMPESVKKRTTRAHSYVFQVALSKDHYYDPDAVRQPQTGGAHPRGSGKHRKPLAEAGSGDRQNESYNAAIIDQPPPEAGRNLLSVWTIPTQAFRGKHYATYPLRIPEVCILASTSERGLLPRVRGPVQAGHHGRGDGPGLAEGVGGGRAWEVLRRRGQGVRGDGGGERLRRQAADPVGDGDPRHHRVAADVRLFPGPVRQMPGALDAQAGAQACLRVDTAEAPEEGEGGGPAVRRGSDEEDEDDEEARGIEQEGGGGVQRLLALLPLP